MRHTIRVRFRTGTPVAVFAVFLPVTADTVTVRLRVHNRPVMIAGDTGFAVWHGVIPKPRSIGNANPQERSEKRV
ncbi:hypothetical protein BJV78DRAFT_1234024 [Lactifluus subvellereus]|nr:hypothetical protein BJV78DRAFT_1234024 [Lactifluus subvellereus]